MPIKKSELHSSLWKSRDELRGGNERFTKLMDRFLPQWLLHLAELNRALLVEERGNY